MRTHTCAHTHTHTHTHTKINIEEKSDKKKHENRLRDCGWHIPDNLAEILFPLMKSWKICSIRATASKNHRVAPEESWVRGGGIEIACICNIYGRRTWTKSVCEIIKDWEC